MVALFFSSAFGSVLDHILISRLVFCCFFGDLSLGVCFMFIFVSI